MTENEIKNTKEWIEDFIETYALSNQETIEFKKLVVCLEEIQQYRAIGTVKGYERAVESSIENYNLYKEYKAKVQDFEAIGTVEEFQHFITAWDELKILIDIAKNELSQYKSIGTVDEFKALKEKNVAKKPKMIGYRKDGEPVYECGCCGNTLKVADQPFCMICSCKIDWQ